MLMYFPEHINLQKVDNGYSLLHVAAANGRLCAAELIAQQVWICAQFRQCTLFSLYSMILTEGVIVMICTELLQH